MIRKIKDYIVQEYHAAKHGFLEMLTPRIVLFWFAFWTITFLGMWILLYFIIASK